MSVIVPKSKTKGVDICDGNHIVRSDLGCYMMTLNIHTGQDSHIYSLHPSCKDGDHYLSDKKKYYIIKGDSYRTVNDLTDDSDSAVYKLHPNCRGGDHYLFYNKKFNIIFQEKGVFRQTSDLKTDKDGIEEELHTNFRDGLYFWNSFYGISVLKPRDEWGVQFCVTSFLKKEDFKTHSVHPDVVNFLPGGLTVTQGPAFRRWELIKTINNDSDTTITWEKKIKKKVGYNKSKTSRIEHNWKVSGNITCEPGQLVELIANLQFSLSVEYGGLCLNEESENWEEETEEEESVTFPIQPKHKKFMWQYKLGFGKENVLFCPYITLTDDPNPPTDSPLKMLEK